MIVVYMLLFLSFITPAIASDRYNAQQVTPSISERKYNHTSRDEDNDDNYEDDFEEGISAHQSATNNTLTRSNKQTEIIPEVDNHGCLCM